MVDRCVSSVGVYLGGQALTCALRLVLPAPLQSALRFQRLRLEKRHNYVRKVAELAVQFFIKDNKVHGRAFRGRCAVLSVARV